MGEPALRHIALTLALLALPALAPAQTPVLDLQDLTATVVATGITHAGDIEVDGQGNIWCVQSQATPGGVGALLTRISPAGVVTANIGAPLSEMGDLVRGQDGFLYVWMNVTATSTSLCQILPNGSVNTIFTLPGFIGGGIEQDANGEFYIGCRSNSPNQGIHRRTSSGTMTPVNATGIPGGDHRHLLFDPAGNLFAASNNVVHQVSPTSTSLVYQVPALQGASNLTCLENGYFDHFITCQRLAFGPALGGQVTSITPEGYPTRIGNLGIINNANNPVVCDDGTGFGYYLLSAGTLYHLTGPAGMLTIGYPTSTTIEARVDHDGSSAPFVLAMDAPGINLNIAGWGTFATSIGTGPSWTLLLDGLGAFGPADPAALAPWNITINAPNPALNQTFAVQAYILDPFAGNGLIKITNWVSLPL